MDRSAFRRMIFVVVLGMSLLGSQVTAQPKTGLGKYYPGYEVARYLPVSGKLVLEKDGEFHVLRQGDDVPGLPGVRLASADRRGALLIEVADGEGAGAELKPKRWLRLVPDKNGGVEVISIVAQPDEGVLLPESLTGLRELDTTPTNPPAERTSADDGEGQ